MGRSPLAGSSGLRFEPGESRTLGGSWNIRQGLTGRVEVYAQFDGVVSNPVSIFIQSPLLLQVMTDLRSYRRGMPVAITLAETNTSDQDVLVHAGCPYPLFAVRRPNGKPVWAADGGRCPATQVILGPGESRTFTALWDGQPNFPGAKLRPGRYVLEAKLDGIIATTPFTIARDKS